MDNIQRLICIHCYQVNELTLTNLTADSSKIPNCIECNEAFNGQPLRLNDNNFAEVITHTNLPIVVDFWSIGCGPCKAMMPDYADASVALFPNVILAKVNIETSPQMTEKYDVRGLPTFILFKNGQSTIRKVGAMTADQIVTWVKSVI